MDSTRGGSRISEGGGGANGNAGGYGREHGNFATRLLLACVFRELFSLDASLVSISATLHVQCSDVFACSF